MLGRSISLAFEFKNQLATPNMLIWTWNMSPGVLQLGTKLIGHILTPLLNICKGCW